MIEGMSADDQPQVNPLLFLIRIGSFIVSFILVKMDSFIRGTAKAWANIDSEFVLPTSHMLGLIILIGTADNMFNDSRVVNYIRKKVAKVFKKKKQDGQL